MADDKYLSTDIYEIVDFVQNIEKNYMNPLSDETLLTGTFGYLAAIFSNELQNATRVAAQYSNEAIPTKAKFEQNILGHALSLGMSNLYATPEKMIIMICLEEEAIARKMEANNNRFILDKDVPIFINGFEYHLDYDIIITRRESKIEKYISGGLTHRVEYMYSARYDMDKNINPISTISNPNLNSIERFKISDGKILIGIPLVVLRQIQTTKITKKILTDNPIENKIMNFSFTNQLVHFFIEVKESGKESIFLDPMYEGAYNADKDSLYFYYSYINNNTIRIKFDQDWYIPVLNAEVTIHIYTCMGASANFKYDKDLMVTLQSTKYDYTGVTLAIVPQTGSEYGTDRKTTEEVQKAIAKEALARGSITNDTDLQNFFNSMSNGYNKLYFYKKRHNQKDITYYTYYLLKNSLNNIIPTNTIDIQIKYEDIKSKYINGENIIIPPGTVFGYGNIDNEENNLRYGHIIESNEDSDEIVDSVGSFRYMTPFLTVFNIKENYMSYYLTSIEEETQVSFDYINSDSTLQFIATGIEWNRRFSDIYDETEPLGRYNMYVEFMQNMGTDFGVVEPVIDQVSKEITGYTSRYNAELGEVELGQLNSIVAIAVFYEDVDAITTPYKYCVGELVDFNSKEFVYRFKFNVYTTDLVKTNGSLSIVNPSVEKSYDAPIRGELLEPNHDIFNFDTMTVDELSVSYSENMEFKKNMGVKIYVLLREPHVNFDNLDKAEDSERFTELKMVLGNKINIDDTYTLTNIYTVINGVSMYQNYTNIMESPLEINYFEYLDEETINKEPDDISNIIIRKVPLISKNYINPFIKGEEEFATIDQNMKEFVDCLEEKRRYIVNNLEILEDCLDIDLKFFNTYGPSNLYYIDYNKEEDIYTYIDRVDITLEFNIKLVNNTYSYLISKIKNHIKEYVENIDSLDPVHIPNIITEVTSKYREYVIYFEFVSFNYEQKVEHDCHPYLYGPGYQHIIEKDYDGLLLYAPEFLNIRNDESGSPDILINIV